MLRSLTTRTNRRQGIALALSLLGLAVAPDLSAKKKKKKKVPVRGYCSSALECQPGRSLTCSTITGCQLSGGRCCVVRSGLCYQDCDCCGTDVCRANICQSPVNQSICYWSSIATVPCPPNYPNDCCTEDYPYCSFIEEIGCCSKGFPYACPPTPTMPDRPTGYCCQQGSFCCSTGCCRSLVRDQTEVITLVIGDRVPTQTATNRD